jgi:phosphatidate cytidylyltransferase
LEDDPFPASGRGHHADADEPAWGDETAYLEHGSDGGDLDVDDPDADPEIDDDDDRLHAEGEGYSAPAAASPTILRFEDDEAHDDGREAWSSFAERGPRWRTGGADFDEGDEEAVAALGSADTRVGTLDPDRAEESDLYRFADEGDAKPQKPRTPRAAAPREGARTSGRAGGRRPPQRSSGGPGGPGGSSGAPRPGQRPASSQRSATLAMRVGTGVLLIGIFLGTLAVLKEKGGVALVAIVAALAVLEFYTSLRQRGFQPAVLPGAVATLLMPIAAYSEGPSGIVLTVLLATIATLLWYLFGVVRDRPAVNMAVTLLGVLYIGVLASTAGLFLHNDHGVEILAGAVIGTIVYDMVGFFVGANLGSRALAPDISPNKTVEGLVGGMIAAVIASIVLGKFLDPWSASTGATLVLGVAIAVMAPLGDLTESMIKRDLGIKDMGTLLPGHGGVLDRVDAILFTVPAVYCIARWKGWAP